MHFEIPDFPDFFLDWLNVPFYILDQFEITIDNFIVNGHVATFSFLDALIVLALASLFISFFVKGISIYVERGR